MQLCVIEYTHWCSKFIGAQYRELCDGAQAHTFTCCICWLLGIHDNCISKLLLNCCIQDFNRKFFLLERARSDAITIMLCGFLQKCIEFVLDLLEFFSYRSFVNLFLNYAESLSLHFLRKHIST